MKFILSHFLLLVWAMETIASPCEELRRNLNHLKKFERPPPEEFLTDTDYWPASEEARQPTPHSPKRIKGKWERTKLKSKSLLRKIKEQPVSLVIRSEIPSDKVAYLGFFTKHPFPKRSWLNPFKYTRGLASTLNLPLRKATKYLGKTKSEYSFTPLQGLNHVTWILPDAVLRRFKGKNDKVFNMPTKMAINILLTSVWFHYFDEWYEKMREKKKGRFDEKMRHYRETDPRFSEFKDLFEQLKSDPKALQQHALNINAYAQTVSEVATTFEALSTETDGTKSDELMKTAQQIADIIVPKPENKEKLESLLNQIQKLYDSNKTYSKEELSIIKQLHGHLEKAASVLEEEVKSFKNTLENPEYSVDVLAAAHLKAYDDFYRDYRTGKITSQLQSNTFEVLENNLFVDLIPFIEIEDPSALEAEGYQIDQQAWKKWIKQSPQTRAKWLIENRIQQMKEVDSLVKSSKTKTFKNHKADHPYIEHLKQLHQYGKISDYDLTRSLMEDIELQFHLKQFEKVGINLVDSSTESKSPMTLKSIRDERLKELLSQ